MPKLTDWLRERVLRDDPAAPHPAAPKTGVRHGRYKVRGMTVYLDGRDLPLPCARCRGISQYTCDYPVAPGGTCNAPLCAACAKPIGDARHDRHLCPIHAQRVLTDTGPLL